MSFAEGLDRPCQALLGFDGVRVLVAEEPAAGFHHVLFELALALFDEGDEVVLTKMEHHSDIVPWQLLAARTGVALRFADVTEDGRLDLDDLDRLLGPATKLVCVTHVSNGLGTINPIGVM